MRLREDSPWKAGKCDVKIWTNGFSTIGNFHGWKRPAHIANPENPNSSDTRRGLGFLKHTISTMLNFECVNQPAGDAQKSTAFFVIPTQDESGVNRTVKSGLAGK